MHICIIDSIITKHKMNAANHNQEQTQFTSKTPSVVYTGIPKPIISTSTKSARGRKPKNTIEHTKQKITETMSKQTQPITETTVQTIHEPEITLKTFHYNFSEQIAERFMYFATLHRYDDRKTFKESWQKWILEEDVAADIQTEIQTLESNHYVGDIMDKMFKSVRYYYRKKPVTPKPPTARKEYVALPVAVLESMDKHIIDTMIQNTNPKTTQCGISPAKAFELYMKQFTYETPNVVSSGILQFIQQDQDQDQENPNTTIDIPKYKKTYKNRFFIASKNIRQISSTETTGRQ